MDHPILVFGKDDRPLAQLDNRGDACHYKDDEHVEDVKGLLTYTFTVPTTHADARLLTEKVPLLFRNADGSPRLVRIERIEDARDGDRRYKTIYAENAANELLGYPVDPHDFTGETPATALGEILAPTRYEVGQVDSAVVLPEMKINDLQSALEAVQTLADKGSLEVAWRVTYSGSKITHRYVDLVERLGVDTGRTIEYRKDVKGLRRTTSSTDLYTALVGKGGADSSGLYLDFSSVEWTVASGDPVDKPVGQNWVGDEAAREIFGLPLADGTKHHITGVYEDPDCADAALLLQATYADLLLRKAAKHTYEVDIAILDDLPGQTGGVANTWSRVRLGDGLWIRDVTYDPPLSVYQRGLEIHRSYAEPWSGTVGV